MNYKNTLNLLQTDFPMKANLSASESKILSIWEDLNIYSQVREYRKNAPKYILHDGPPYANGNIHLGQVLNKILKDIFLKFKTMRGYDCPYIPGWDTQGLPTEQNVQKEYNMDRHSMPPLEWRHKCQELALKYVDIQKQQFKRLGVRADWDNPYLTLSPQYQAKQIEAFGAIALKGLAYRSLRPVAWCYHCETALAEDEIEHKLVDMPSIHVAFQLKDQWMGLSNVKILTWTTTPWSIPGNTAIAVNPNADYVTIDKGLFNYVIVAESLLEQTAEMCGFTYSIIDRFKGSELEGLIAMHPLYDRESRVITADFVTMDKGTGCVHIAPAHGDEDYQSSLKYDLPIISPIDDLGRYTEEAGSELHHLIADQSNNIITKMLKETGALYSDKTIPIEYPHCWRCHQPIIHRALRQWFIGINNLKEKALQDLQSVNWEPEWGQKRMAGMIENRPDWCISRQRSWGLPLPIFYCQDCGATQLTKFTTNYIRDLFSEFGADVWFDREASELMPIGTKCHCGCTSFVKEQDTMSVWFDSGVSHYAVLQNNPDLSYPADLYLEGDDQYQCWFQTSLWVAKALGQPAPFKTVVGHAFFVDETGEKMSKSKKNIIPPDTIYEKYGADVLRMWFTYADFRRKMYYSEDIIEQVSVAYRKIRNVSRFMLQNLADFDPAVDYVDNLDLCPIDLVTLNQLGKLIERMTDAFDNWDLHLFYHDFHGFVTELSATYFSCIKDALYTDATNSHRRRGIQTVLWELLINLTKMMAPVLTFTAEEIWQYCREIDGTLPASVQLTDWPISKWDNDVLLHEWERILNIREQVMVEVEKAKDAGLIETAGDAKAIIGVTADEASLLQLANDDWPSLFSTSQVEVKKGDKIEILPATGFKCARCWRKDKSVGVYIEHPSICQRCIDNIRRGANK